MWGRISSYQGNGDEKKECKLNVGYSESKPGSNNCGSEKSPMTAASPLPMVKLRQCSHLVRVERLQDRWRRSITMTTPFAIRMYFVMDTFISGPALNEFLPFTIQRSQKRCLLIKIE